MHPTPIFRLEDEEKSFGFIASHPFALLAVNGENGPVTALVPLVLCGKNTLLGHTAKANPFWQAAQKSPDAIAVFRGPEAYISPSYYASKAEHGKVVPTWNYVALEVRGKIEVETDPLKMTPYLEALTQHMEADRDVPWNMSDAPDSYITKLSRAITGFRLTIEHVTHVRKLNQNKSAADQTGVINSLLSAGSEAEKCLAAEMRKNNH